MERETAPDVDSIASGVEWVEWSQWPTPREVVLSFEKWSKSRAILGAQAPPPGPVDDNGGCTFCVRQLADSPRGAEKLHEKSESQNTPPLKNRPRHGFEVGRPLSGMAGHEGLFHAWRSPLPLSCRKELQRQLEVRDQPGHIVGKEVPGDHPVAFIKTSSCLSKNALTSGRVRP